jgi:energy-coupling factor transport system ATP-binding protein
MNNIISINNLNYYYNDKQIFDNLTLSIEEGTWVTIAGSNGCGKTTLVKILSGIIKVRDINYYNIKSIKKDIGILFENPRESFIMDTVRDEIYLSLNSLNLSKLKIEEKIEDISDLLNIEELMDKDPKTLSGGELQRVALASVLIYSPKILILDDALSMINVRDKYSIIKVIKRYKKDNNMTVINFTDDLEESFGSNRLVVLDKGKIILDGKPKEVMENDTMLNRMGVEIPFIVDLSSKLKLYGLIEDTYFDDEKLVNDIWK